MAVRKAKGDDALSHQVRKRQDLANAWQRWERLLIAALAQSADQRKVSAEQEYRARLAEIEAEVAKIDRILKDDSRICRACEPGTIVDSRVEEAFALRGGPRSLPRHT
jgi:hypothetical protein